MALRGHHPRPEYRPGSRLGAEAPHRQEQPGPHGPRGADRQLFPGQIQGCEAAAGCHHQHRKSGVGNRPPVDSRAEDIPHASGDGTHRRVCRAPRAVRPQAGSPPGTAEGPVDSHRPADCRHRGGSQVHESLQADEDVQ